MYEFVPGWVLIYTRPNQEKKAFKGLSDKRIESYLPLVTKIRHLHDRRKIIETPLFPSYVFARLGCLADYYSGSEICGFINYVKAGGKIAIVSQSIIDSIKMAIRSCEVLDVNSVIFEPGQKLMVKSGPLTGLQCEMIQYNGKQKALVRISLLNRNLLVDLSVNVITSDEKEPIDYADKID